MDADGRLYEHARRASRRARLDGHRHQVGGGCFGVCLRLPNARRFAMYVRVVRFTDVSAERLEGLLARIRESDGPPPGVPSTGLTILFDEARGTAVVLQYFATAEDAEAGGKVMG